jgi:hypothetical protein
LIAEQLSNLEEKGHYDKESQLQPNHTDEKNRHYCELLDKNTVMKIESVFAAWLSDFGYISD